VKAVEKNSRTENSENRKFGEQKIRRTENSENRKFGQFQTQRTSTILKWGKKMQLGIIASFPANYDKNYEGIYLRACVCGGARKAFCDKSSF
jgi:hypothetical protein